MNKNRDNTLCEYSDEESAFVKGALSSNGDTEGVRRFRMEMCAKEYALFDFSMFADAADADMDPTDQYMQERDPDQMTGEEYLAKAFAESDKNPASEEYRVTGEAYMVEEDGHVIVCYMESLDGETEQLTEIHFDRNTPGLVTICKTGMATTTMTIEAGRRHSCVYRTPYMDFEMRIRALRVDNNITESGGRLKLDYALEIRGAEAHRTVMEIILGE